MMRPSCKYARSKLTRHETVALFLQVSSHTDDKGQLDGDKDGRSGVSTFADLQLDDDLDYLKASYADTYAACSKALLRCCSISMTSYFAGINKHRQSSAATAALADVKTRTPTSETNSRCHFDRFVLPIRVFNANTALVAITMLLFAARLLLAFWQGCAGKICRAAQTWFADGTHHDPA